MCLPRHSTDRSSEFDDSGIDSGSSRRRQFSAEYKLRILREADACERPGEVGDLLRREGLYFSHLTNWRSAREKGELAGLEPRKRGRKPKHGDPRDRVIGELRRENARLRGRAERAEKLIEMQKRTRLLIGDPGRGEQREMLVELVREAAKDVGVRTACDVFGVSRASFYRWSEHQEESDHASPLREVRVHAPASGERPDQQRSSVAPAPTTGRGEPATEPGPNGRSVRLHDAVSEGDRDRETPTPGDPRQA